ncbi:MAG: PorT family protein [Mucilaginibacter sp.]|nr:PorT family protein [Mucilaginibacter sp.]
MKKLLFLLHFTLVTTALFAQDYSNDDKKITFGLSGGSSFADMQVTSPHSQDIYATEAQPVSIGLTVDFKFNDYFSIMPGIAYAGKGGELNATYGQALNNEVSIDDIYKLHYLQVPVDFIGHLPFESGANIFLGAGPYFSYGLNGTNTQTNFDQTQTQHIKFGSNGDFKSTDYGVTSIIGFQAAKGWLVGLNIEQGFANIMQNNTTGFDASKIKTFSFYFSVGQSF